MKKVLFVGVVAILLISCESEKEDKTFTWSKDHVGHLTRNTQISELDSIFANDSIVNPVQGDEFINGPGSIEIYEKGGTHLLSITPKEELDNTSKISYVLLRDPRYTTAEGINLNSAFKDIDAAYKITSVDNIIDDAMIRVDQQNFYFTISKEKLPSAVRYDSEANIEKTMVPDDVKPETIFVSW
jgi:hypothetical protein